MTDKPESRNDVDDEAGERPSGALGGNFSPGWRLEKVLRGECPGPGVS